MSPPADRRRPRRWLPWVAPWAPAIVARALVGTEMFNFEQLIAAVIALGVLILIAKRPTGWVAALIIVLPFQLLLTSFLYELGVGGGLTRMAALWKELVVFGVAVAAWRRSKDRPGRLDALDRVSAAFVLLGTLYLLLPEVFVGDPGSTVDLDTRFVAWRLVVLPSVLLLACRRLRATADEVRTLIRGTTVAGLALAAVVAAELLLSDWWNRLLVDTLGVNRYRFEVLQVDFRGLSFVDIRVYGRVAGREIIRLGGPMISHLTFSFVLFIALAVLVERLVRSRGSVPTLVATAGCAVGLLFTQTRSTIVAAGILLLVALRPVPGRPAATRARYAVLAALVGIAALPLAFEAGLDDRFTEGDQFSDAVHDFRVDTALETVVDRPLGLGLAMGSTAGGRAVEGSVPVENQLLDTAVQLGVLGAALFVAQYLLLALALRRAVAHAGPASQLLAAAAFGALVAFVVPLWYQQAFGLLEVAWVLFAIAGTALGAAEEDAADPERRRVEEQADEEAAQARELALR